MAMVVVRTCMAGNTGRGPTQRPTYLHILRPLFGGLSVCLQLRVELFDPVEFSFQMVSVTTRLTEVGGMSLGKR